MEQKEYKFDEATPFQAFIDKHRDKVAQVSGQEIIISSWPLPPHAVVCFI